MKCLEFRFVVDLITAADLGPFRYFPPPPPPPPICYQYDPNIYLLVEFHLKCVDCCLQCTIVRKHS